MCVFVLLGCLFGCFFQWMILTTTTTFCSCSCPSRLLPLILPLPLVHPKIKTTVDSLLSTGAITKSKLKIHKVVVGKEDFTAKDLTVQAHAFTANARAAIEAAGGKCELLNGSTGIGEEA